MSLYIILFVLFGTTCACPNLRPVENSDTSNYVRGTWYEIARYDNYDVQKDGDCITYTFIPSTSPIHNVTIRMVQDNKVKILNSQLYETEEPGKVVFHSDVSNTPYVITNVLATDNESYYIFYNCFINNKNQAQEYAWIVSKTPTLTPELKYAIHTYVHEIQILNWRKFVWDHFTHDDCKTDKY